MTNRILVADDHRMVREALCHLLQAQPDLEVVAKASDGNAALDMAHQHAPDAICMDIQMPGMRGVEATRALRSGLPNVKVVAMSTFVDQSLVLEMIAAGAMAYVTKNSACEELLDALRAVLQGRTYFCADASAALAAPRTSAQVQLGRREEQVLRLVTEG